LLIAVVLLCAYRFWKQPSLRRMIWLGVALGLTMLARDELTLLVVFIVVHLALLARPLAWKRRFLLAGVGVLATATVIAPWVGYNMSRFEKPTFISTGLGVTLASADCNTTFNPPIEGYWSMRCALAIPRLKHGDESAQSANYESHVIKYLEHHKSRWVPVSLAKIGRAFGLYEPIEQINLDSGIETRPLHWAFIGLYSYYVLGVLSLIGTVLLMRRRIPVFPMWAIGLNVVIACIIAFGNTRYRTPFEVCLVIMAAVPIEWVWSRILPERRSRRSAPPPAPSTDEAEVPQPALSGTS
jgi:4-amino-4-deoxy-L-arabinose transferase-like glycosyltransferase